MSRLQSQLRVSHSSPGARAAAWIAAIALSLAACSSSTPTPTATLSGPPAETAAPIATDGSWARVQTAGKLVVGTSADYPPFEFYNTDFQLDGFDIALMKAIGQKLGVQVEFNDYAFDGLPGALLNREFDAAIAALSVTEERRAFADFSMDYYVGDDALLGRSGSNLQITAPEQLAPLRVGVERGSVYDAWLALTLVDAGLMPRGNLFVYAKIDDAVRDLGDDRLDVVMLDFLPAQTLANQGQLAIVGRGLSKQHFAIMARKGENALLAQLNEALRQLLIDGTYVRLGQQYLDITLQPPPLPTPAPPQAAPTPGPTATPQIACDLMQYVADLSYDDQNMTAPAALAPGQAFTKGWRIRNTGSCAWDNSYAFVFLDGNVAQAQMGGGPVALQSAPPGGTTDVYVNLLAPLAPGTYQGFWAMRNAVGQTFGERVWVGITVPGQPTPYPTQTPVPNIQFNSNRGQVNAGEAVEFTWNVQGVKAVYFYEQGQPWEHTGVGGVDSRTVYPQQTTNYELRVVQQNDQVVTRAIQIIVNQPANLPQISEFSANPDIQVQVGGCVQLHWDVRGQVDNVRLLVNGATLWDGAPVNAGQQHCPAAPSVTYTLEARGPGGTSRSERRLSVVEVQPPQVNSLANTSWGVTGVYRQPVALETGLEMRFDGGTSLSGYAGCNTYNAFYGVSGSSLGISALTQSLAECADRPGIMDLERSFFDALRETRSYEIVDSQLILRDGNGLEVVRGLLRP